MNDPLMREFLAACGSTLPWVLGVEEPGSPSVSWRVFDEPFLVVGRELAADLRLNDAGVSRRHCYLQLIAGRMFCVDLQSRTGTRWGEESGLWGWVRRDTGIGIGPFRLRTRDEADSTLPVPVSRAFEQPNLPEATVEILGNAAGSTTWRVSRTLALIGGSQACKIRLRGGGVAEIHASLLRTPAGLFAMDLLGPGGISINGTRVRWAKLGQDDEIRIGEHRLRIRCGGARHLAVSPGAGIRPQGRAPLATTGMTGTELMPAGDDMVALVKSMLDEFGEAQTRMADRFQETLMVLLKSFAGMHGEQMSLIREEMGRIDELARVQRDLQSRLDGPGQVAKGLPALRLVTGESKVNAMALGQSVLSGPVPAVPESSPLEISATRAEQRDPMPPRVVASQDRRPPVIPSAELHAQIVSRLASIQEERNGRWQKLLKVILG